MAQTETRKKRQGMNWCHKDKRLAIYLRDGLSCVYCSQGIADGVQLTLDHIIPDSQGGSNKAENLITCCMSCNRVRYTRPVFEFCESVAGYVNHGVTGVQIYNRIQAQTAIPINTAEARAILSRASNWSDALKSVTN